MPKVLIDGVEYVPRADILPLTDDRLKAALSELVSIQYFKEAHKAIAQAWNVLNVLAPEVAALAAKSPDAAYRLLHPEE